MQVWQFFLSTGFLEDEVAHTCYTDIDFKAKTIDVREKRQFNWEPKDKAERTVPVPDSLLELLKVRKSMYQGGWLIFPNRDGNPQGHFLRILKERALSAGLDCGHCTGTLDVRLFPVRMRRAVSIGYFIASGKPLRHSIMRTEFRHGRSKCGWDILI